MRYGIGILGAALSLVATASGCNDTAGDDASVAGNSGAAAMAGASNTAGTSGAGGTTAAGSGGNFSTGGDFAAGGARAGGGTGGTAAGTGGSSGFGGGGFSGTSGGNAGRAGNGNAGARGGAAGSSGSGAGGTNAGTGGAGGAGAGGAGAAGNGGAAGTGAGTGGSGPVTYDWVLTAFTNESESNMYVYHSDNGRNFDLVEGPAYTPPGSQLVRDPSVMLHDDGRYYIVYTTGWREKAFGIAYSTDLETWTFLTTVPTRDNATSSWAPEWFVEDGSLHVIISISTTGNGNNYGNFTPHLFTATSDDLMSWDGGVQMQGIQPNYIDTFVVRSGATYHAFTKNENSKIIEHATASELEGPYTFVGTGNWAGWGSTAVEGPCLFQLANGTWRMLVDGYTSSQYLYSDSQDLMQWSARQALPGGLSGFIRHGTVLRRSIQP